MIPLSDAARREMLDIAVEVIRTRLFGAVCIARPCHPELEQPAGCFASLHRRDNHALRGCIGRMTADRPLADAVVHVAGGVLNDPRFAGSRVTLGELEFLEIELSVLSPLRRISSPADFTPREHGIYLAVEGRTGCFLPQVARQMGWNREQLLSRLCTEKMGLDAGGQWSEPEAILSIFDVEIVGPAPMGGRATI